MKLLFKQRLFSWLDSYDIYDENRNTIFTVKGVLAFKHCFKVYDADGNEVGTIRENISNVICGNSAFLHPLDAGICPR